ncbi:cell division protein ZipA [Sansalvadorimonas sp. 2012CJ34-2]|uniref:Cell division protein ZipA n=1 Tax=Parendozoicomonas callyspongiae TaxID=2942213 RepID=A0ABT0PJW4_9GAMM|nr:cell division protein ZipA [Sansalvadorimonas sp. 2012CJ34-2]MCL6271649.1 cell division protein ZipA [Sansalvadorimonas sp. 2012CJ34-2]
MEMNFRDLLVIAGVLVVLGVLADGLRRMWLAKRRANDLNFGLEDVHGCEDDYGSELPNGGARVMHWEEETVPVKPARKEPLIVPDDSDIASGEVISVPRVVSQGTVASAASDNTEPESQPQHEVFAPIQEPVPEPVVPVQEVQPEPLKSEVELSQPEPQVEQVIESEPEPVPQPAEPKFDFKPEPAPRQELVIEQEVVAAESLKAKPVESEPDLFGDDFNLDIKPEAEERRARSEAVKEPAPRRKKFFERPHFHHHKESEVEAAPAPEPEEPHHAPVDEVLIMNLVAPKGLPFSGDQVLASFHRSGIRFGDMNIFHRHIQEDGSGEILFSVANGVEPGTFNLKTMKNSHTPAISFFMGLPGPHEPQQAFRIMAESVHNIARDLEGIIRDDQHSVLTQQTLEHYRQRICDFERRQLTKRNKSTARV